MYEWHEEKSIGDFWLEATLLHETTRKHLDIPRYCRFITVDTCAPFL